MAIKTTGAEWKQFYFDDSAWPEGTSYLEDEEILVNGSLVDSGSTDMASLNDADEVTISGGYVIVDGAASPIPLASLFRKWRKAQTASFFIVEAPNEKLDDIKKAITALGGKVK